MTTATISAFTCPSAPVQRIVPPATVLDDVGLPYPTGTPYGFCDYGSMNAVRPAYFVFEQWTARATNVSRNKHKDSCEQEQI